MKTVEIGLNNHDLNKVTSEEWIAKVERLLAEKLRRMQARQVKKTIIENG